MNDFSFTIVIAAFNAAPTLAAVLDGLRDLYPAASVIVVDDGSGDETAGIARSHGASLIRHQKNLGSGAAFKSGLREGVARGAELLVTMGADNQRELADVGKLIKALLIDPELDVVVGSKFLQKNSIPFFRRCGGRALSLVFRVLFRTSAFTDILSGFRGIRRRSTAFFFSCPDRYEFETACCCEIVRNNLKVAEVPVTVHYHSNSTRMHYPGLEGLRILRKMILERLRSR